MNRDVLVCCWLFFIAHSLSISISLSLYLPFIGSHYANNTIAPPVTAPAAVTTASAPPPLKSNHSVSSNPSPSPVYDSKYSSISNKALKYQPYGQRDAQHTPPMSHSSAIGSQTKTIIIDDEPALDLRNTSKSQSSTELNTTQVFFFSFHLFCAIRQMNSNSEIVCFLLFSIQSTMRYKVQRQKCLIRIVMLEYWICQCPTRIQSTRCAMYVATNTNVAACSRLVRLNRKMCVIEISPTFQYSTNHIHARHDLAQKIRADTFRPAHYATTIS